MKYPSSPAGNSQAPQEVITALSIWGNNIISRLLLLVSVFSSLHVQLLTICSPNTYHRGQAAGSSSFSRFLAASQEHQTRAGCSVCVQTHGAAVWGSPASRSTELNTITPTGHAGQTAEGDSLVVVPGGKISAINSHPGTEKT